MTRKGASQGTAGKRAAAPTTPPAPPKRRRGCRGTETQRIEVEESQLSQPSQPSRSQSLLSFRPSPRKALAASQATETPSSPTPPVFEALLREARDEADIVAPVASSEVATAATDEIAGDADAFEERFVDDFSGIDGQRLRGYCEPVATQKQRKSWIYRYGYRVTSLSDSSRLWFVCKYCHQHKLINVGGSGIFEVTRATSSSAAYLGLNTRGHGYTKDGPKSTVLPGGQLSMQQVIERGVPVS
jgi:hypothetical protein